MITPQSVRNSKGMSSVKVQSAGGVSADGAIPGGTARRESGGQSIASERQ
jgi:hypothetical protein